MTNLAVNLVNSGDARPDHVALRCDDLKVSLADFDHAAAQVATLLARAGVQPGDRVGVMLPNTPAFAIVFCGILHRGAVAVPMNPLLKPNEARPERSCAARSPSRPAKASPDHGHGGLDPKELSIMTTPDSSADAFNGARHVIDGLSVYCVDTAPTATARPTVVAVHGIPESSFAWRDVASVVGDSARMVIPDLPGFGRSDKPSNYDYSLARQSRLLEALLDRVVPEAPIHLAVHDIGGPIGLMWAMRNPDRVASLLVLNTTLFHEKFRPPAMALKSLVPVIGPRSVAAALSRESEFKRRFLRPCARPIDPATLDELYDPYRRPDACRAAAQTWSAYKRSLGEMVRARKALPRITAPTTVLFGAHDPYCTPASARAFASRIPHARLRLLDDVGHFTPTEAPTEVADELNSLLQRAK